MIFLLGSLVSFGPLSIDMYLPSLPVLAKGLHTSTSLSQLSLTFCLIGLSLGQLVAGPLSDTRGRRLPLLCGLVLYTVSSLLCAFSSSIWVLILLRLIQGLSGGAGIVIARAIVRDLYSGPELTKFFSLLMLVNGAAPILAPIIGGQLLNITSWRGVFIVLSIAGAIMMLSTLYTLPETLPVDRRAKGGIKNTLSTIRNLAGDRLFMGYVLAQGMVTTALFAYVSGSPFVLQDIFGVSPQMFSLFFAINGSGIIIASQVTGRLAGRVGEAKLLLIGLGIAATGGVLLLAAILLGAGLAAILPPLFMVVSSVGMVSSASFSLAMQNQGKAAGSASALLGLLSYVSGGIAAPLVGIAGNHSAVPMGIIIALAEAGAVLSYLLLIRKRKSS